MIRVNLLAERKQKKGKKLPLSISPQIGEKMKMPPIMTTLIMVVIGTIVAMGLLALFMQWRVSTLRAEVEANKAAMTDLQKKIEAAKQYEALNKEIEKKKTLIETLRKSQSVPLRLLDEVTKILPDGVWVTSLNFSNQRVTMEGTGFTNIDIVTLVENLKKSPSFADVYLEETKRAEVEKVEVYNFKLNFNVKI